MVSPPATALNGRRDGRARDTITRPAARAHTAAEPQSLRPTAAKVRARDEPQLGAGDSVAAAAHLERVGRASGVRARSQSAPANGPPAAPSARQATGCRRTRSCSAARAARARARARARRPRAKLAQLRRGARSRRKSHRTSLGGGGGGACAAWGRWRSLPSTIVFVGKRVARAEPSRAEEKARELTHLGSKFEKGARKNASCTNHVAATCWILSN